MGLPQPGIFALGNLAHAYPPISLAPAPPKTGAYYFVPSVEDLGAFAPPEEDD